MVDGPFGKGLHAKLEEKGMVGLAYYELGFRNITNSKRPIAKVEDIAGLKLRVIPNPINVDWVTALGANPTPLPFPELYAALEQKAVDGQENPVATIQGAKLYEVQKYMTLTNHQYNPQSVVISKKFWDTLSADEKKVVQDAATESAKYQREQSRARGRHHPGRPQEERHAGDRAVRRGSGQAARQDEAGDRQALGQRRRGHGEFDDGRAGQAAQVNRAPA